MAKNLGKVITLVIVIVILYGIVDIYHYQYNIIKFAKNASQDIISSDNILGIKQQIIGKSYEYGNKLKVNSVNVEYRRQYNHNTETNGRIPYQVDIEIDCKQSFLGLFAVERKFSTKSSILLLP